MGKPEISSEEEPPEEVDDANVKKTKPSKKRNIRSAALPKNLPLRTEIIDPEEVLRDPTAWRLIKEDPRDWLEKDPGYFYLVRKIYRTYVPINVIQPKARLSPHRLRPPSLKMAFGDQDFSVKFSATSSSTTCHTTDSKNSIPIALGFTSPNKR